MPQFICPTFIIGQSVDHSKTEPSRTLLNGKRLEILEKRPVGHKPDIVRVSVEQNIEIYFLNDFERP